MHVNVARVHPSGQTSGVGGGGGTGVGGIGVGGGVGGGGVGGVGAAATQLVNAPICAFEGGFVPTQRENSLQWPADPASTPQ